MAISARSDRPRTNLVFPQSFWWYRATSPRASAVITFGERPRAGSPPLSGAELPNPPVSPTDADARWWIVVEHRTAREGAPVSNVAGALSPPSQSASLLGASGIVELGPFTADACRRHWDDQLRALRNAGFRPAGHDEALAVFANPKSAPQQRARAAARLGRHRVYEALPALLRALTHADSEACALLDALGRIGHAVLPSRNPDLSLNLSLSLSLNLRLSDETARLLSADLVTAILPWSRHPQRSRRRAAQEALRLVGDYPALSQALESEWVLLPIELRRSITISTITQATAQTARPDWCEILRALPIEQRATVCESLYAHGSSEAVAVALSALLEDRLGQASVWRHAKGILRRAELRQDWVTYGVLLHAAERERRFDSQTCRLPAKTHDLSESGSGSGSGAIPTDPLRPWYVRIWDWLCRRGRRLTNTLGNRPRKRWIFQPKTVNYLRRRAWRELKMLAQFQPRAYANAAAALLTPYSVREERAPTLRLGPYADCYLLHRILFDRAGTVAFDARRMRFLTLPGAAHITLSYAESSPWDWEAFPSFWDNSPDAVRDLLLKSENPLVTAFAVDRAARDRQRVMGPIPDETLIALLDHPRPGAAQLAKRVILDRCRAQEPFGDMFARIWRDPSPISDSDWTALSPLRELRRTLAVETVGLWRDDPVRGLTFLTHHDPGLRQCAADAILSSPPVSSDIRRAWAEALKSALGRPFSPISPAVPKIEANHDTRMGLTEWSVAAEVPSESDPVAEDPRASLARVAREQFLGELESLVTPPMILEWIGNGAAAAEVGGMLLARHPDASVAWDWGTLAALSDHELPLVRYGAQTVLTRVITELSALPDPDSDSVPSDRLRTGSPEPSRIRSDLLGIFLESRWADNRATAMTLWEKVIETSGLTLDDLTAILDHGRPDVRSRGEHLARIYLRKWPYEELFHRLIQNPDPKLRRLALDLALEHLPPTAFGLGECERFFRAGLLDPQPRRTEKDGLFRLLRRQGLHDRDQARIAVRLLEDLRGMRPARDAETAFVLIAELLEAWPDLTPPPSLRKIPKNPNHAPHHIT